jgi:hypothetical protein
MRMDPNPIKDSGTLLMQLSLALMPALQDRGFTCDRTEAYGNYRYGTKWVDFSHADDSLSIMYRDGYLLADFIDSRGAVERLVQVDLDGTSIAELLRCMDLFVNQVSDAISRLPLVDA